LTLKNPLRRDYDNLKEDFSTASLYMGGLIENKKYSIWLQ
jgi:hypothetical protein